MNARFPDMKLKPLHKTGLPGETYFPAECQHMPSKTVPDDDDDEYRTCFVTLSPIRAQASRGIHV